MTPTEKARRAGDTLFDMLLALAGLLVLGILGAAGAGSSTGTCWAIPAGPWQISSPWRVCL